MVAFADNLDGEYPLEDCIMLFMDDGSIFYSKAGKSLPMLSKKSLGSNIDIYDNLCIKNRSWYATSKGLYVDAPNGISTAFVGQPSNAI